MLSSPLPTAICDTDLVTGVMSASNQDKRESIDIVTGNPVCLRDKRYPLIANVECYCESYKTDR